MGPFHSYIGLDYSGAGTALSPLPGLSLYAATEGAAPGRMRPPGGSVRYWTRRDVAAWLAETLRRRGPMLVGVDHGFSFPVRYFETHGLAPDWSRFLDDFQAHWPTDEADVTVEAVRRGQAGSGLERRGDARWRRLTEVRSRAKSVFHFDVPGSVAKSTHAGLPWLRHLRRELGGRCFFWPFDGWTPRPGCSVIAEVYPALCNQEAAGAGRTAHEHDAWSVARWMQQSAADGTLTAAFAPRLTAQERETARVEGWILGCP